MPLNDSFRVSPRLFLVDVDLFPISAALKREVKRDTCLNVVDINSKISMIYLFCMVNNKIFSIPPLST